MSKSRWINYRIWPGLITFVIMTAFLCQDISWAGLNRYYFENNKYKLGPVSRWEPYFRQHELDLEVLMPFLAAVRSIKKVIDDKNRQPSPDAAVIKLVNRLNQEDFRNLPVKIVIPEFVRLPKKRLVKKDGRIIKVPYLIFSFYGERHEVYFGLDPEQIDGLSRQRLGMADKEYADLAVVGVDRVWINSLSKGKGKGRRYALQNLDLQRKIYAFFDGRPLYKVGLIKGFFKSVVVRDIGERLASNPSTDIQQLLDRWIGYFIYELENNYADSVQKIGRAKAFIRGYCGTFIFNVPENGDDTVLLEIENKMFGEGVIRVLRQQEKIRLKIRRKTPLRIKNKGDKAQTRLRGDILVTEASQVHEAAHVLTNAYELEEGFESFNNLIVRPLLGRLNLAESEREDLVKNLFSNPSSSKWVQDRRFAKEIISLLFEYKHEGNNIERDRKTFIKRLYKKTGSGLFSQIETVLFSSFPELEGRIEDVLRSNLDVSGGEEDISMPGLYQWPSFPSSGDDYRPRKKRQERRRFEVDSEGYLRILEQYEAMDTKRLGSYLNGLSEDFGFLINISDSVNIKKLRLDRLFINTVNSVKCLSVSLELNGLNVDVTEEEICINLRGRRLLILERGNHSPSSSIAILFLLLQNIDIEEALGETDFLSAYIRIKNSFDRLLKIHEQIQIPSDKDSRLEGILSDYMHFGPLTVINVLVRRSDFQDVLTLEKDFSISEIIDKMFETTDSLLLDASIGSKFRFSEQDYIFYKLKEAFTAGTTRYPYDFYIVMDISGRTVAQLVTHNGGKEVLFARPFGTVPSSRHDIAYFRLIYDYAKTIDGVDVQYAQQVLNSVLSEYARICEDPWGWGRHFYAELNYDMDAILLIRLVHDNEGFFTNDQLVVDDSGEIFYIRQRGVAEYGSHEEKNDYRREILAQIIGTGLVNTVDIREIFNYQTVGFQRYGSTLEGGWYLSRIAANYRKEDLVHKDPRKARSAQLVFQTLIRKWDPHAANRELVGGVPILFDNDCAFDEDFQPIRIFADTYKEHVEKLEDSRADLSLGGYSRFQIERSTMGFQERGGYETFVKIVMGSKATARFIKKNKKTLRRDVYTLLKKLTGEDFSFDKKPPSSPIEKFMRLFKYAEDAEDYLFLIEYLMKLIEQGGVRINQNILKDLGQLWYYRVIEEKVNCLQDDPLKEMKWCGAIGDIHGNAGRLKQLSSYLIQKGADKIIFLGDYFDRDRTNIAVFNTLKELDSRDKAVFILGNHDLFLLLSMRGGRDAFKEWLSWGGIPFFGELGLDLQRLQGAINGLSGEGLGLDEVIHKIDMIDMKDPSIIDDLFKEVRENEILNDINRWLSSKGKLFYVDDFGTFYSHAGIPLSKEGIVNLEYKGLRGIAALKLLDEEFRHWLINGTSIEENFSLIAMVIKLLSIRFDEWISVLNGLDIDRIKALTEDLGVLRMVFAHTPGEVIQNYKGYIFGVDLAAAEHYGGLGGAFQIGPAGIKAAQFISREDEHLEDLKIQTILDRRNLLNYMRNDLMLRSRKLRRSLESELGGLARNAYLSGSVPIEEESVKKIKPQRGKRANLIQVQEDNATVSDSKGVHHTLGLIPQGELDIQASLSELRTRMPRENREIISEILSLLPDRIRLFTYGTLIEDLFGFAVSDSRFIAVHELLKDNAVALFHELTEYLIQIHKLQLGIKDGKLVLVIGRRRYNLELGEDALSIAKKGPDNPHYLICALQRKVFGSRDEDLTNLLKTLQIRYFSEWMSSGGILDSIKTLREQVSKLLRIETLHPVNKMLLQHILNKIDLFLGEEEKDALVFYLETLFLVTAVIHSQAWLSPTYLNSAVKQRGILQGDGYPSGYERDELDPYKIEDFLSKIYKGGNNLLYRNLKSAVDSTCGRIYRESLRLNPSGSIVVSPNFPKFDNLEALNTGDNRIKRLDSMLPPRTVLDDDNIVSVFIEEQDVDDINSFLEDAASMDKNLKYVIIHSALPIEISLQLINKLNEKSIVVCIIYSMSPVPFLSSLHSSAPSLVVLYNDHFNDLLEALKSERRLSLNIDSFSEWYLSLLFNSFRDKDIDNNPAPDIYNMLDHRMLFLKRGLLIINYKRLLEGYNSIIIKGEAEGFKRIIVSRIREHLQVLDNLEGEDISEEDIRRLRSAAEEYRTLLKHLIYLKSAELRQRGDAGKEYDALETKIEDVLNRLIDPVFDTKGKPYPKSSIAFWCRMAAVKAILRLVSQQNGNVLSGNGVYYEIEGILNLLNPLGGKVDRVRDQNVDEIIKRIESGEYVLLFIDLICNSLSRPSNFPRGYNLEQEDLAVVELKQLLNRLIRIRYIRPFYLAIDISMFGTAFQLTQYIQNIRLPRNFHIILYGSLQKLYQNGMELTTGGVLTLISGDEKSHQEIAGRLRMYRWLGGLQASPYNYMSLDMLGLDRGEVDMRTTVIFDNTKRISNFVYREFKRAGLEYAEVIHPSVPKHRDHRRWRRMGMLGPPFFFIRLDSGENWRFCEILEKHLESWGICKRDSYGFDVIAITSYYPETEKEALRISLSAFTKAEMADIERAFSSAITEFCQKSKGKTSASFLPVLLERQRSAVEGVVRTVKDENIKDKNIILAWDDNVGIVTSYENLLTELELRFSEGNVRFIRAKGGELQNRIETEKGKLRENTEVILITNIRDADSLKSLERRYTVVVDDKQIEESRYLPILEILTFAMSVVYDKDNLNEIGRLYKEITNIELTQEQYRDVISAGLILLTLQPIDTMEIDQLGEVYKSSTALLTAA